MIAYLPVVALFALIFRLRGETGYGRMPASLWWGFFSTLLLNNNGHSTLQWLALDFIIITLLFNLGARPGWSERCWPAWQSAEPVVRRRALVYANERATWFWPLLMYVSIRAGHPMAVFPLLLAFDWGFALCFYYCKDVADRLGFNRYGDNSWPVGELMLGAWLGFIQFILSL